MTRSAHARFDFGLMAHDYERWYETAEGKAHDREQKAAVREMLPAYTPGASLLDVGCGTGHWSRFFASLGFSVTGVDIAAEMLGQARSHVATLCHYGIADAGSLPFSDATFKVVAAMAVIGFVSAPDAAVAEMFRCVRQDGTVVIGALNALAPLNRERVTARKEPYASARLFTPAQLQGLLGRYGTVHMFVTNAAFDRDDAKAGGAFMVAVVPT
ncbi:MAG TPA: methyltransferase domain-containing protein [Candidatus Hydrogenedentes bacterium]|nr:methyltransferase domain-containing protein [Candidatus Hydrogenedentota bacterium]